MTRDRLDDRTKLSLKAKYWCDISTQYNDEEREVNIDVGDEIVNQYLQSNLSSKFRTVWSDVKLHKSFQKLRAAYEGSKESHVMLDIHEHNIPVVLHSYWDFIGWNNSLSRSPRRICPSHLKRWALIFMCFTICRN